MGVLRKLFATKKKIYIIMTLIAAVAFWRFFVFKSSDDFQTSQVKRGNVKEELILSGAIQADEHANLSFLTAGELDLIEVNEGDTVGKGQRLARLDTTVLYQTYLQAEADLRRYQASLDKTYDDVQGHNDDESFSQRESRTIAEANKDKAYRAYIAAQKNLSSATLRAPFDGVVTAITHPYTGINTSLTESQIEIVNPQTLYFAVSADQTEVTDLKIGQKVAVVLDSYPDEEIQGEVTYISYTPLVGESGSVYKVKVRFLNHPDTQKVRIGMSGDAKFIVSEKSNVLYVEPDFVNSESGGKYLNLGKKNNKIYVDVGIEGEDRVEIEGEVNEGDTVYD